MWEKFLNWGQTTMFITADQAYNIAQSFISTKDATIEKLVSTRYYYTHYTITVNNLRLDIDAPHGGPRCDWLVDYKYRGIVTLYQNGRTIMLHVTKHTVDHAMNKSKYNPVRIVTRMLSPEFFKIIDLAEDRINNRIIPLGRIQNLEKTIHKMTQQNQK